MTGAQYLGRPSVYPGSMSTPRLLTLVLLAGAASVAAAAPSPAPVPPSPAPPAGAPRPPPPVKPVPPDAAKVTLTGPEARTLTGALKLAGVASKKAAGGVVYAVTKLSCTTTDGSVLEDGLASTKCQAGAGKAMSAVQSAVLDTAVSATLGSKGLAMDDHMSKSTYVVESIACTIGPDAKAPKSIDRFSCAVTLR